MSIRIAFDNRPEFYTNLDFITGRVVLGINRPEQVGSIVVKLEGESITAIQAANLPGTYPASRNPNARPPPAGGFEAENHKILYKVQQVFPDEYHASSSNPYGAFPLQPGEHVFPFKFKMPVNNGCGDPVAMSKIGGLSGAGGFGSGGGLFGIGGVRFMDGTKQLYLRHVNRTLPPSLTGFPMEAEIRYYIKVTIQRPGFLKENWRYQVGLKFLPIEPPRPKLSGQEAFARRPFTFRPRSPSQPPGKMSSFFSKISEKGKSEESTAEANGSSSADGELAPSPSIEVSARLPHPSVVTCNQPVPLRLVTKRLNNNPEQVYLVSFQMDLIGYTEIRAHGLVNRKVNRWVIMSNSDLSINVTPSTPDELDKEVIIPDTLWNNRPLPNTVAPSFFTCNLSRRYEMELKIGLSWGVPKAAKQAQTIYLPLHFANVEVYSGITPPAELLQAAQNNPRPNTTPASSSNNTVLAPSDGRPQLPPRTNLSGSTAIRRRPVQPPIQDPLYPPPLVPGQEDAPFDDAPPSYDEAIAENLAGPFDGMQPRPAYSGVTNENAPSQMPTEKS